MKRLTITYDGITLFDDDVATLTWQDEDGGVTVSSKPPRPTLADIIRNHKQTKPIEAANNQP